MNNYFGLSEEEAVLTYGYVIVEDMLFEVENSRIVDEWDLSGDTIEEMVKDAIEKAELSSNTIIYYDDENYYDKNLIMDEGRFVSPFDVPTSEDEESFFEYCANH